MNRNVLCKVRASFHMIGDICRQTPMPGKPTLATRKQIVTQLFLALVVLVFTPIAQAQTVWSGAPIIFTKVDGADWNLEKNQDRITDNVWITRKNSQGIFNIYTESGYTDDSPADTEWAYGSAADWADLTFQTWVDWADDAPPSTIGQEAVVHLISEDIYIDITFLSWTCCGEGGGFSYERSTPSVCPWDLDGSGSVGTGDLLALFSQWGTDGPADFDGSGAVGTGDLLILFANWGPCP